MKALKTKIMEYYNEKYINRKNFIEDIPVLILKENNEKNPGDQFSFIMDGLPKKKTIILLVEFMQMKDTR